MDIYKWKAQTYIECNKTFYYLPVGLFIAKDNISVNQEKH